MESILEELFGPNHNDGFSSESYDAEGHEHEENDSSEYMEDTEGSSPAEEINGEVQEPQTNMVFESKESLFASCQAYAKSKGFSVIYRTVKKVVGSNEAKYLLICCDRAGKADTKKSTKKNNCPARVNATKQNNGCWRISTVHLIHNHELEPHMSIFMAAYRSVSINMGRQLEGNDISGLKVYKNVRLLEVQAGGPMNLGCNARDCKNYIEKRRRLRLSEGDA